MDDYIESTCDECDTPLVKLDGDWFCPECGDADEFHLVPHDEAFRL